MLRVMLRPQQPGGTDCLFHFALGALLSLGFIIEGLVVKSFYFLNNDPIVAHYALSSMISMIALAILFLSVGMRFVSSAELLLFISAVLLSVVSSIVSGQGAKYGRHRDFRTVGVDVLLCRTPIAGSG